MHDKDLGTKGTEDTLSGKMKEAAGKIESKLGELTGNRKMEARGDAKQVGGKVQATVGKVEHTVDSATLDPNQPDPTRMEDSYEGARADPTRMPPPTGEHTTDSDLPPGRPDPTRMQP